MKLSWCLLAIVAAPLMAQSPAQEKHRIAVMDFQYATVMSSVQAVFGTTQDVGRGVADLLVDRLVNDGEYRVIERRELDKVLKEQNFSNSDRADANTAAKIGRLLGVEAIVVGDITQFGRDDRNTNLGGIASRWDKYGIGKVGAHKAKAVVAVTARLVDVNTGEILASASGRGESTRSGTDLLGGGGAWSGAGGGQLDMGSTNFQQTILGEAVQSAVGQLATALDQDAGRLHAQAVEVNGLVADATGNTITINVGSRNGVHVGDTLAITRVSRVIKDPATGKTLRTVQEPVGQIQITSVEESYAVGKFSGTGQPKTGDTVTNAQH
jgi:curli biogenesis system outer membrane secretion channel CsgG